MGQRCTVAADLYSFGILLIELITQEQSGGRGEWRLPRAPEECPQVRKRVGGRVAPCGVVVCITSTSGMRGRLAKSLLSYKRMQYIGAPTGFTHSSASGSGCRRLLC